MMTTVHPHVRGEYPSSASQSVSTFGPSPRAWGIRRGGGHPHRLIRSIPTCVGNTGLRGDTLRRRPVHPHVRGEYQLALAGVAAQAGPSPRAWGILRSTLLASRSFRSIPTCVGNTASCAATPRTSPVHPHVRGEYLYASQRAIALYGPSPRAWGIPLMVAPSPLRSRSIPTCVGNTLTYAPRSRTRLRSIPTCVGNTAEGRSALARSTVHPHVRGEYRRLRISKDTGPGPSPRAWGIHYPDWRQAKRHRSIPTCVGNTKPERP